MKPACRSRRRIGAAIAALNLLVGGCAAPPGSPFAVSSPTAGVQQRLASGDYAGAARELEQQAATRPQRRSELLTLAAEAHLSAGDQAAAERLARAIDPATLTTNQRDLLFLVQARLAVSRQRPEEALELLTHVRRENLPPDRQFHYAHAAATSLQAVGRYYESAAARVALDRWLQDPAERARNHRGILAALAMVPLPALDGPDARRGDWFAGWLHLSDLLRQDTDPATRTAQIQNWRRQFPDHPASETVIHALSRKPAGKLRWDSVAVLLPRAGVYAPAATALRRGFMEAYERDTRQFKPDVRYYDSAGDDAAQVYRQAVAEGAQIIVGPLVKIQVQKLSQGPALAVPVLALNQTGSSRQANLYQFALNPEDEADQVAQLARQDGGTQAITIAPASNYGKRLTQEFKQRWQQLGAHVLAQLNYTPQNPEVEGLLTRVGRAAPDSFSQPQPELVLFLVATPEDARRIVSAFRNAGFRGSFYGSSLLYGGRPDPAADRALDGVSFCDAPWVLPIRGAGDEPDDFMPIDPAIDPQVLRLIPFGHDAFQLLSELETLKSGEPYHGVSGDLVLTKNRQIHRRLYCARFADGIPRLRGLAPPARAGR